MHDVIAEEWEREMAVGTEWQRRWEAVFANGFERTDNEILLHAIAPEMVGSTASVVVLSGCQIITSNCGDSRVVLCRRTQTIPLTVDQKVLCQPFLDHIFLVLLDSFIRLHNHVLLCSFRFLENEKLYAAIF